MDCSPPLVPAKAGTQCSQNNWIPACAGMSGERKALAQIPLKGRIMADHVVPHFHNDPGVPVIEIGAKEFMCIGATPPFDHPHVFCDMGDADELICSYCSTLYRLNP